VPPRGGPTASTVSRVVDEYRCLTTRRKGVTIRLSRGGGQACFSPKLIWEVPANNPMIRAIIFDLDGVISDTQEIHASVESKLLQNHGIKISAEELTTKYAGVSDKEFFGKLLNELKVEASIDEIIEQKWVEMMKICQKGIEPIEGAIDLIRYFKRRKFEIAVASASPREFVDFVLEKLNAKRYFDTVVSEEEVRRGKPDPEIFLLAARKLKLPPWECLVIEDGVNGMVAARRAGMRCIGYVRKGGRKGDCVADFLVDRLSQIESRLEIQELLAPSGIRPNF